MSGVAALTIGGTSGAFHDTSSSRGVGRTASLALAVQSGGVATIDGLLQMTAGGTLSLGSSGAERSLGHAA
ncbi:MAG TPA: hypothetical protein VHZ24_17005 [Pirellulales bacterium]|nr:hypothetical protein [Pirellulales bacterium]